MSTYYGSCLCGQVTYTLTGDFDSLYLCYCSRCQKGSGSAHASNVFAKGAKLVWNLGGDLVKTYQCPNSRHSRSFCSECGSGLPIDAKEAGFVMVPVGSLDSPITLSPTARIFTESAPCWVEQINTVPSYKSFPDV